MTTPTPTRVTVLHLAGKGIQLADMPLTIPVLRVLEALPGANAPRPQAETMAA